MDNARRTARCWTRFSERSIDAPLVMTACDSLVWNVGGTLSITISRSCLALGVSSSNKLKLDRLKPSDIDELYVSIWNSLFG